MNHAICILSSLGEDYLINCINQFEMDPNIYFFIHTDLYNTSYTNNHILYIGHYQHSKRFSMEMVNVMMFLIDQVNKSDICFDYIHFFSDTCKLIVSVETFKKFFKDHNGYSFVECDLNNEYYINDQIAFKGSQWMSLHCSIFNKLNMDIYNKYNHNIYSPRQCYAPDEFIIQTIIKKEFDHNVINNSLRYYEFELLYKNDGHPSIISLYLLNLLNNKKIDHIKNNCLIARKLDFKQFDYYETLQRLYDIKNGNIF